MLPNIGTTAFVNRNVNKDLQFWAVWAVRALRDHPFNISANFHDF